jgi:hypothetical protein
MRQKRVLIAISGQVKLICEKLEADKTGNTLTRNEKALIVTREEAAEIASVIAGRKITPEYIRQLTRGERPRLVPEKTAGNTYLYKVADIINVRFTKPHKATEEAKQAS